MNFDNLVNGMFIIAPEDETVFRATMCDYYCTGEKTMCLMDERSLYPASEICQSCYVPLYKLDESDIEEIATETSKTAVIKTKNCQKLHVVLGDAFDGSLDSLKKIMFQHGANYYYEYHRDNSDYDVINIMEENY